jgi:hypothetical protein
MSLPQASRISWSRDSGGWDWLEHDDPRLTEVMKGYALWDLMTSD